MAAVVGSGLAGRFAGSGLADRHRRSHRTCATAAAAATFDAAVSARGHPDGLFVATGRRVVRIDPTDGRTIASAQLDGAPRAMVETRGSVWVTVEGGKLLQLDSAQLGVQRSTAVSGDPDAVTVVPGSVYVTDDRDHTLLRVDPRDGR